MFALPLFLLSLILRGIWPAGSNEQPELSANVSSPLPNSHDAVSNQTNQTEHDGRPYAFSGIRVFNPELEIETRIIGGKETWAHSWPWQLSLRYATMSACGGAVIDPLWIITAAHCFVRFKTASSWTVMAGKHDLDNAHESSQQLVGVSRIVSHQGYNKRTKEFDVALLKLQEPLRFNKFIRPIQIWTRPLVPPLNCTITGWGSTRENGPRVNRLQEVNVTLLTIDNCNEFYKGRIRPTMFCAGDSEGGVDACQGDSGGPLSCYTGQQYELAGVVSWGVGCGRARRPGVYTKLQHYSAWISDTMSSDQLMTYSDSPNVGRGDKPSCGEAATPHCHLASLPASLVRSQDDGGAVRAGGVTEACPFSWPWQASLQAQGQHYCSGTLVHRRWVLAPRHCNAKVGDMVVLGVHDLRFMASQSIPVEEVYEQAQDRSFPPNNDLALIRLGEAARTADPVFPVCLPDDDIEVDDSWTCVTTAWGHSEALGKLSPHTLHQAKVSLVNLTACRHIWGEDLIRETHLCVHPVAATPCMGDGGSPLVCQKHGVYFLFGVVTWGGRHCDPRKPAVFSSITDFQMWIRETTDF